MQLAYKVTSEGSFAKDFEMRDQFRSAALSAMTNVAEGFDNESTVEFARFLGMARRSAEAEHLKNPRRPAKPSSNR